MDSFCCFGLDLCKVFKRNFLLTITTPLTGAVRSTNAFAQDQDRCDPGLDIEDRWNLYFSRLLRPELPRLLDPVGDPYFRTNSSVC